MIFSEIIEKRDAHLEAAEAALLEIGNGDGWGTEYAKLMLAQANAHATLAIYYDRQAEFLTS